jgi:hypothetical protein
MRAAESLARELGAALTVYNLAGPAAMLAGPATTYRPETQILQGLPAEEIAGRAYGVLDLLFVHRALLGGNVSGALVRRAGCPVIVS